jgi:hypothetical protein
MQKFKSVLFVLVILTLQNIIFFFKHYFQGYAIPWDFCQTYHAIPYHWIELVKLHIDTSWIPFAGMGYPLFMNLQSGFFYPFFWWFVIFNQSYTFHAAVIMEGIHVLFGGIGAAICARLLGLGWRHALLTGVLYQGFGGFYSNAEHPDIVRSYALIPWISSPVFASWNQLKQSRLLKTSISALPFFIYCAWAGGYPGVTIASFFILGIIVLTRLYFDDNKKVGITILLACAAGTLLAAIFLAPVAMQVSEISRASSIQNINFDYLLPSDIFSLIYSVDNYYFGHDISMRSLSVGLPAIALLLIGLINLNWRIWNKWVFFSGILALLMSTGLLHGIVIKLLSPIGFSRFTLADYKGFIALAIILLAVSTLPSIENTKRKDNYIWAVVLLLFLWIGNQLLSINKLGWFSEGTQLFFVLISTIIVFGPLRRKKPRWVLPLIIIITLFDWGRIHWETPVFAMKEGQAYCEAASNRVANKKLLDNRLANTNECRQSRVNNPGGDFAHYSWRGYYSGEYMMQDYSGPMKFNRQQKILANTGLTDFAALPWHMVIIPNEVKYNTIDFQSAIVANVKCISYGTTEIHHVVDVPIPSLAIENEIYWLGWQAKLINLNNNEHEFIKPIDVNGFRGWYLPAGKYEMVETYETPYKKSSLSLAILGGLIWLSVLYVLWDYRIQFNFKRKLQIHKK